MAYLINKILLLFVTLYISLGPTLSSETSADIFFDEQSSDNINLHKVQHSDINNWNITGAYDISGICRSDNYSHFEKYALKVENSHIKDVTLVKHRFSRDKTSIFFTLDIVKDFDNALYKALWPHRIIKNSLSSYKDGIKIELNSKEEYNTVLEYYYNYGYVPDFLINRILELKDFKLDDFRLNSQNIIKAFEHTFITNATENVELTHNIIEAFFIDKLNKINTEHYKNRTCLEIITYLQKNVEGNDQLLLKLCSMITDKSANFYYPALNLKLQIEAESVLSNLRNLDTTITDYYSQSIIKCLDATEANNYPEALNMLVKPFVNNGLMATELPRQLRDLTVSSQTVFNLLDHIRELKLEISELKK